MTLQARSVLLLVAKMLLAGTVIFSILVASSWGKIVFPPRFKFGAATSAYQVEGTASTNMSESIWSRYSKLTPSPIRDGSNGDVACDSYSLWKEDVRIAHDLGLDFYRFSISWPRLLPSGFHDKVSEDGVRYYSDLIDGLLEKGIKPIVTIYHWDLPQRLQDLGGWTNPLISDWFADYARMVYSLYGDRVNTWITINEPLVFCHLPYISGLMAPGIKDPDHGYFLCIKHVTLAHAKAWRVYDEEFRGKFHGKVSYTNALVWLDPQTPDDKEFADLTNLCMTGLYSHPVYSKEGGWPEEIERTIAEYSKRKGYKRSILPKFSKKEIQLMKGTFDFYALNYYVARSVRRAKPGEEISQSIFYGIPFLEAVLDGKDEWEVGWTHYFTINPESLRFQLKWIKQHYGDVEILIMENGYADTVGNLEDDNRIRYLRNHMEQVLLAVYEDGVNVTHYTVWTLIDNFEWAEGYTPKFGLYAVDFDSPNRTRTPRASAGYYANVIKTRTLDVAKSRVDDEL